MIFKRIFVLLAVIMTIASCACTNPETGATRSEEFSFSILKVGKADAIIMQTQNHCVVIDCGEDDDGDEVAEYLYNNGISSVDCLFVTHFDKDHVGGVPEVIEKADIKQIITPNYEDDSDEYENYVRSVSENGIKTSALTEYTSFSFDNVLFEIYPPQRSSYKEDNDYSLAIAVTHGENSFLFAGDAEEIRMKEIVSQTKREYDFLKFPHHGVYNNGVREFAESVKPAYCVITCSDKNPAGQQTVNVLEALGCNVYYTRNGNVNVKSDGAEIIITQ